MARLEKANNVALALKKDGYYVWYNEGFYHIYENNIDNYFCSVEYVDKNTVRYNGKEYDTRHRKDIIKAVEEYAKTLFFPVKYYDPMLNKEYLTSMRIDWYMHRFGFKRHMGNWNLDTYNLNDSLGNNILSIAVVNDRDKESGKVVYNIASNQDVEMRFDNAVEAINHINTILQLSIAQSCMIALKTSDLILGGTSDLSKAKLIDTTNIFNMKRAPFKDKLREIIDNLNKQLENA